MEDTIIYELKPFINRGYLEGLKEKWSEYQVTDFGREIAWDYIFQKVYLHACLKKKKDIAAWLITLYSVLNPMSQIALRQVFSYGNYLLNK